jgi:hypothetical protein
VRAFGVAGATRAQLDIAHGKSNEYMRDVAWSERALATPNVRSE